MSFSPITEEEEHGMFRPAPTSEGFGLDETDRLQQSGTEFARTKEQQAAIMRQKQDEGPSETGRLSPQPMLTCISQRMRRRRPMLLVGRSDDRTPSELQ